MYPFNRLRFFLEFRLELDQYLSWNLIVCHRYSPLTCNRLFLHHQSVRPKPLRLASRGSSNMPASSVSRSSILAIDCRRGKMRPTGTVKILNDRPSIVFWCFLRRKWCLHNVMLLLGRGDESRLRECWGLEISPTSAQKASRHDSILIPIHHLDRPPRIFKARCSIPPSEHSKADAISVRTERGKKMIRRIVRKIVSPPKARAKDGVSASRRSRSWWRSGWNADFQGVEASFLWPQE